MSVKLRFRRDGRKKLPVYGLVATDSRSPRDGRFIEFLGRYEPVTEPAVVRLDAERIVYWLSQGAQPSDTVRNLLQREGILLRWALTRRGESEEAIETAVAELKERRAAKGAGAAKKTPADRRAEALEAERKAAKERAAELAKQQAEREAELRRQREEAEAAERAAAEEARAEAAQAAADSEALTTAADKPEAPVTPEVAATDETEAPAEAEATATEAKADATAETPTPEASDVAEVGPAAEEPAAEDTDTTAGDEPAPEEPAAESTATQEAVADEAAADEVATEEPAPSEEAVPAEEVAPAEGTASTEADDLTAIWGVGPTYAGILTDAGLTTYAAVAEKSVEEIQALITEAGSTTAGNEETWPEQARLLAAGDTEGHEAYVETLKSA